MASSAKEHNGTFKGPKSFQQTKKSWSAVLSGGSHINSSVMSVLSTNQPQGKHETLTSSAASLPPVDHVTHKVARPYLTGSIANSVLIDIAQVLDRQKEFIVALAIYCESNIYLASDDLSNSFAEIVKLSLTRLPPQYGRQDGGNQQLKEDMQNNLNQFEELIDCGCVTGGSGIYAGGGYAFLSVDA